MATGIAISYLDKLLEEAAKHIGQALPCEELLRGIGYDGEVYFGYFMIDILLDDGYLRHAIEGYSMHPVVSISPKGFVFIATGGYAAQNISEARQLKDEQTKMQLELIDLKWGLRISIASLLFSILAMLMAYYK